MECATLDKKGVVRDRPSPLPKIFSSLKWRVLVYSERYLQCNTSNLILEILTNEKNLGHNVH